MVNTPTLLTTITYLSNKMRGRIFTYSVDDKPAALKIIGDGTGSFLISHTVWPHQRKQVREMMLLSDGNVVWNKGEENEEFLQQLTEQVYGLQKEFEKRHSSRPEREPQN